VLGDIPKAPPPTQITDRGFERWDGNDFVPTGRRPYTPPTQGRQPQYIPTPDANSPTGFSMQPVRPGLPVAGPASASKPLPTPAITSLSEAGSTAQNFTRLSGGFQDGYAGYKIPGVGSLANFAGRNIGMGMTDQAQWWSDYQNEKNITRNRLFGSALTATEKAEFDKANIEPGMRPDVVRNNLERQRLASMAAAYKLAGTYAQQGYSQEAIETAVGFPIAELERGAAQFRNLTSAPTRGGNREQRPGNPIPEGVLPTPGIIGQRPPSGQGQFRVLGPE
jgi:hypothetical protein